MDWSAATTFHWRDLIDNQDDIKLPAWNTINLACSRILKVLDLALGDLSR